jgi:hypothetical protein
MKRYFSLFLIAVVISYATVSSAQKGSFYAGVSGGLSLPSGNFAQSDYGNNKSGFATSGFNFGLTGVYFLNKNFGVGGVVSYSKYGFKGAQNLADGYKEAFGVDSATVYIKGDNHSLNIMVGPYYSLPLKKFNIDYRLLVGLVNASLAGNEVFLEDNPDNTFSQKNAKAATVGIQAGIGARYSLNKNFGVVLNVDYFYSKPSFSIENVNRANEAGRKITTYSEPLMGLNTNLSLVYQLKH